MTRAQAAAKVDAAFDAHMEKLVDVLMANCSAEPNNVGQFVANFHRGMAAADSVHARVTAELETIFPE